MLDHPGGRGSWHPCSVGVPPVGRYPKMLVFWKPGDSRIPQTVPAPSCHGFAFCGRGSVDKGLLGFWLPQPTLACLLFFFPLHGEFLLLFLLCKMVSLLYIWSGNVSRWTELREIQPCLTPPNTSLTLGRSTNLSSEPGGSPKDSSSLKGPPGTPPPPRNHTPYLLQRVKGW